MRSLRILAVSAGLLTAAPLCIGAQVTTAFTATANVVRGCAIATTDMNFGSYPALPTAPTSSATSTITVTCELDDTYTIGLDDGSNSLGALRRMARVVLPVAYLNYGLYQDAAYFQIWRDTGPTRVSGVGTGFPQVYTVYGQLPGAQVVPVGTYVDTVTVTVRN
jgi:spore coat protein U-like protein